MSTIAPDKLVGCTPKDTTNRVIWIGVFVFLMIISIVLFIGVIYGGQYVPGETRLNKGRLEEYYHVFYDMGDKIHANWWWLLFFVFGGGILCCSVGIVSTLFEELACRQKRNDWATTKPMP